MWYIYPGLGTGIFVWSRFTPVNQLEYIFGAIFIASLTMGILLGLSRRTYERSDKKYDGDMIVTRTAEGKRIFNLALNSDPNDMIDKDRILFKVVFDEDSA